MLVAHTENYLYSSFLLFRVPINWASHWDKDNLMRWKAGQISLDEKVSKTYLNNVMFFAVYRSVTIFILYCFSCMFKSLDNLSPTENYRRCPVPEVASVPITSKYCRSTVVCFSVSVHVWKIPRNFEILLWFCALCYHYSIVI